MQTKAQSTVKDPDYLAEICHEIGTPLTTIANLTRVLSSMECSDRQKCEYVEMLRDSSHMLMELLNDLFDFSRLKVGRMEIEHTCFNLTKAIEEAVHIVAARAEEKGLTLHVHISNCLPDRLMGDPLRIRQILLNLLANAIKFTEWGLISLYVNSYADSNNDYLVSITVADSGIGMNDAEMERIFDKYAQANANVSRNYGGTGLGLSISRNLAHLMHGDITVKSWPGVGSHFTVTLPLQKPEQSLTAA